MRTFRDLKHFSVNKRLLILSQVIEMCKFGKLYSITTQVFYCNFKNLFIKFSSISKKNPIFHFEDSIEFFMPLPIYVEDVLRFSCIILTIFA